jgi:hypothetical protein
MIPPMPKRAYLPEGPLEGCERRAVKFARADPCSATIRLSPEEIPRKAWPIWPPPPAAAGLTIDLFGEFSLP